MTVVIKKVGGSLAVIIPSSVARESHLTEGTALEMTSTPDGIAMRRPGRRPRRSMKEIVGQLDPAAYARHSADMAADRPVGKEIW